MQPTRMPIREDNQSVRALRGLASALSRAAGAPLVGNNHVRLLKDARQNYPAWLGAINTAEHHVHFENYFRHFAVKYADALLKPFQQTHLRIVALQNPLRRKKLDQDFNKQRFLLLRSLGSESAAQNSRRSGPQ